MSQLLRTSHAILCIGVVMYSELRIYFITDALGRWRHDTAHESTHDRVCKFITWIYPRTDIEANQYTCNKTCTHFMRSNVIFTACSRSAILLFPNSSEYFSCRLWWPSGITSNPKRCYKSYLAFLFNQIDTSLYQMSKYLESEAIAVTCQPLSCVV